MSAFTESVVEQAALAWLATACCVGCWWIDWTLRENVRALLRVLVKRILRQHGYPPDKQEKTTQTVQKQAALLTGEWAAM